MTKNLRHFKLKEKVKELLRDKEFSEDSIKTEDYRKIFS